MAYSVETLKSWRRDAKSKRKTNKRRRDAVRKPYDNGWKMDDYYSRIKKKVDDCTSELENGIKGMSSVLDGKCNAIEDHGEKQCLTNHSYSKEVIMVDITYDVDKLRKAKEAIDGLIDNLNDDNKNLTEALADLEVGWKTDAGTKFFDEHKDTWSEYVKKYVKKLTGVSDMLQKAIDRYENIGNEVKNLKV